MVSFSFLGELTMASAVFNSDVTSGVTISMSDGCSDDSTRIVIFMRDVVNIFFVLATAYHSIIDI